MSSNHTEALGKFPVIQTNRLSLIEINQTHLGDIFKIFSDPDVVKYYDVNAYKNEEEGQKLLDLFTTRFKEKKGIRWGIALKGHKNLIGTIGFNSFKKRHKGVIGYDLQKAYWGKGYTTEAIHSVVDFGFNKLEINRIEAVTMLGNIGSQKVLIKNRFKKEGTLRQWFLFNGVYHDMNMFSLLREEFDN